MSKAFQHAQDAEEVVSQLQEAVKIIASTMGPNGSTVAIQSPNGTDISVRDGVTVARSIRNLGKTQAGTIGLSRLINACEIVVQKTGDGTTTTAVLVDNFIDALQQVASVAYPAEIRRIADSWLQSYNQELAKHVRKIDDTDEDALFNVALMATSNETIARAIAKAVISVGAKGDVSLRHIDSDVLAEYTERAGFSWNGEGIVAPIQFDAGSPDKRIFLDNATVYFLNAVIETQQQAEKILKAYLEYSKSVEGGVPPLVIIASGFVGDGLGLLIKNTNSYKQTPGTGVPSLLVKQPDWGYEAYVDMSHIFGAPIHGAGGIPITNTKKDSFGRCGRVEVRTDFVSIQALPEQADRIVERILSAQEDAVRFTRLTKGVVQILIGGRSDAERQKVYELVEDAYRTCQSALRGGVVTGGGKTWLKIREAMLAQELGSECNELTKALTAIPSLLLGECGLVEGEFTIDEDLPATVREALETDLWFDLIDDTMNTDFNLIDSAEIYEWAVKTALSVALEICTTEYFITWETETK
jgi:chaperonin GroEL (HSP60 family)